MQLGATLTRSSTPVILKVEVMTQAKAAFNGVEKLDLRKAYFL